MYDLVCNLSNQLWGWPQRPRHAADIELGLWHNSGESNLAIETEQVSQKAINTALVLNTGECHCEIVLKASFNQTTLPLEDSAAGADINFPPPACQGEVEFHV